MSATGDTAVDGYPELEPDEDGEEDQNFDARPISSQPNDWNISTLRDKFEKGQVDLQPSYQREYVWELKPELPSRLVESLFLEIPVPPIYFGKLQGGRLEVIDGQQRLTTLIKFVRNEFPLQRLQRMGSLNGKFFRDLSDEHQAKVMDAPIRSIVIDAGTNQNLRYEVFERLNRGSMGLNEQELRNCVYRGPFCDLLAELEKDPVWRKIKGGDKPEPRFVEREMILRFLSLANRLGDYKGKLKGFLNDYMGKYAPKGEADIKSQAQLFRQTMNNVWVVFGEKSARLYSTGTEDRPTVEGRWESKFSISALDIQASALAGQHPGKVQAASEQVREMYVYYLLTQPQVRLSISRQPAGTAATKLRWMGFREQVQVLLDGTIAEPRFFTFEFRRQLFQFNPACNICGNEIHALEDSAVDHVHPYSRGGRTIPENAQLAHRSCNARKSTNPVEDVPSENARRPSDRPSVQTPDPLADRAAQSRSPIPGEQSTESPRKFQVEAVFPLKHTDTLDEESKQLVKCPICPSMVRKDRLIIHLERVHNHSTPDKRDDTTFLEYLSDKNLKVFASSGKEHIRDAVKRIFAHRRTCPAVNPKSNEKNDQKAEAPRPVNENNLPPLSISKKPIQKTKKRKGKQSGGGTRGGSSPFTAGGGSNLTDWDFD